MDDLKENIKPETLRKEKTIGSFLRQSLVLDTESTGIDANTAEICEIGAVTSKNGCFPDSDSRLFGTKELIPFAASSKNNISRSMLAGLKTADQDIENVTNLLKLDDDTVEYLVAHNYQYDKTIISTFFENINRLDLLEKLNKKKWICTYRAAQQLFKLTDDNKDLSYSLNYLRYYCKLPTDGLKTHRAEADSIVCWHLLRHISFYVMNEIEENLDIGEFLYELTSQPIIYDRFPFGKHKGCLLSEVPDSYYQWLLKNADSLNINSNDYNPDLATSIENELNRRQDKKAS